MAKIFEDYQWQWRFSMVRITWKPLQQKLLTLLLVFNSQQTIFLTLILKRVPKLLSLGTLTTQIGPNGYLIALKKLKCSVQKNAKKPRLLYSKDFGRKRLLEIIYIEIIYLIYLRI